MTLNYRPIGSSMVARSIALACCGVLFSVKANNPLSPFLNFEKVGYFPWFTPMGYLKS
jgi:hypothetical protein